MLLELAAALARLGELLDLLLKGGKIGEALEESGAGELPCKGGKREVIASQVSGDCKAIARQVSGNCKVTARQL